MAAKPKQPELRSANLSLKQIELSIHKIDRRIADLENFDISSINDRHDPRIQALENQLDTLLVSIFSAGTIEYYRYRRSTTKLNTAPLNFMYETPIEEVREGLYKGTDIAKAQLEAIKAGFLEELGDTKQTLTGKALKAYEGLDLHPAIESVAGKLFRDGHYSNAVEDAVKALNALVRMNSGVDDKDGIALMECVFNPKNPVLRLNNLSDVSEIDEQKGFMMMFCGAIVGLRNPRAHKIIKDNPEMALEFITFISLLAKIADRAYK